MIGLGAGLCSGSFNTCSSLDVIRTCSDTQNFLPSAWCQIIVAVSLVNGPDQHYHDSLDLPAIPL